MCRDTSRRPIQRIIDNAPLGGKPLRFYVASALTNIQINAEVARALTERSWGCFLPQRDAPSGENGANTSAANIEGILGADVVLALGYNMGKDTAWEVGFAYAHGIPVVLVHESGGDPSHDMMVFHSAAAVFSVPPNEAPASLPALLDDFLGTLRARGGDQ